jgi:hypothetical protein
MIPRSSLPYSIFSSFGLTALTCAREAGPRREHFLPLDHFDVARHFRDRFFQLFGRERLGIFAGEFFVLAVKSASLKALRMAPKSTISH